MYTGAFISPFSHHLSNFLLSGYSVLTTHYSSAPVFFKDNIMFSKNEKDISQKKKKANLNHIKFYEKIFEILMFILDEYSRELVRADIEFLEMPKSAISTLEFLISAIIRIQKGQRLALGLDENEFEDTSPQINIIEGICEEKI